MFQTVRRLRLPEYSMSSRSALCCFCWPGGASSFTFRANEYFAFTRGWFIECGGCPGAPLMFLLWSLTPRHNNFFVFWHRFLFGPNYVASQPPPVSLERKGHPPGDADQVFRFRANWIMSSNHCGLI